jgi:hypothetical protein
VIVKRSLIATLGYGGGKTVILNQGRSSGG